jgi:outer membrane protein assembly factor BamB
MYIGATGSFLYALNAATEMELWRVQADKGLDPNGGFPKGGAISSPLVVGGVVYFGGMDGKLYAVSTAP